MIVKTAWKRQKIEVQLNNNINSAQAPTMLISWDIDTTLAFDENGFLKNPSATIIALLVKKAIDTTKAEAEKASEEMGYLFREFIKDLYTRMVPFQKDIAEPPISNASYKLAPAHGAGKHSGILSRWTMRDAIINCTPE